MKRNKIILVNLPPARNYTYDKAGTVYPATSLLLLGTILKKKGFDVYLVDGAVYADYQNKVIDDLSDDVLFVGLSIMTSQLLPACALSQEIKNIRTDIPIIFGGIHPTLYPEQTVKNACVDIAVINEGSKTVMEIVEYLNSQRSLSDVKGIAYKNDVGVSQLTPPQDYDDISCLPHIDFDLIEIDRYLNATSILDRELNPENDESLRLMPILTGLGCCYQCNFCVNVILKRKYRYRSAVSIVDEIKRLQKKYNANAFLFFDEDFFISRNRLLEFIELVEKEKLRFKARIWARVSYFSKDSYREIIPKLESIGIRSIAMGAESGSQKMLDHIKKGIKVEDTIHAAKELAKTNITARFSMMIGLDSETKEDVKDTYRLCGKLLKYNKLTDIAGPFIYRYYPGSQQTPQLRHRSASFRASASVKPISTS